MLKRNLAIIMFGVTAVNIISTPVTTLASNIKIAIEDDMQNKENKSSLAKVTKFNLYGNDKLESYNNEFKVKREEIKSITNNGGAYGSSSIEKSIDENFSTHWETGNPNGNNFINEVTIELNEAIELNRMVYGARQDHTVGKGFAKKFEIYGAESDSDDYKLVTKGSYGGSIGDIIEIKFDKTKLKKIKFKFEDASDGWGWASACEFMLYKEDLIRDKMETLFTDNTMSKLSSEFNSEESLNKLEEEVKIHPLYDDFKEKIDLGRDILKNENIFSSTVWELESRGNSIKESQERKLWNFQDWQPTGYSVKSGDKINVYVDVEEGKPLPYLMFKQMDSQHNGNSRIDLINGKNTIIIPEVSSGELRPGTAKGGVLYTVNPYTKEEQGRAPKIRFEGIKTYPHYIKGKHSDEEVMKYLEDYVNLLKEDPSLPDVFDIFGDKTLVNVKATYALDWYKKTQKLPSYTATEGDNIIAETMKIWGFDESEGVNSDFNFRYVSMVKWLDDGGFMNAGDGVTGFNQAEQGGALNAEKSWGFMHELGHNFDFNESSIGEVTNNMLPLYYAKLQGEKSKISEQGLWENNILPKVALDDYHNNEYYPEHDTSLLTHIAPLWQLQLYNENFWPEFQKIFRTNGFSGGSWNEKHNKWVKVSSDIFKLDLSEHFERHGMKVTDDTKAYSGKYEKPDKKLWYINDKIYINKGGKFTNKVNYSINSINQEDKNVRLNFTINNEDKSNLLGYEVYRDGEIIAFTAENTFLDKTATKGTDHKYEIIAYDLELNQKLIK